MPIRKNHEQNYAESPRRTEIPEGTSRNEQDGASQERKRGGSRIPKGASIVPSLGGRALKGRTKLSHAVTAHLTPALKRNASFLRKKLCGELARDVGAGRCGILASALVKLGAEDMALREAALAAGNTDLARKLGQAAQNHLLFAREVAAKDGKDLVARQRQSPYGNPYGYILDQDGPDTVDEHGTPEGYLPRSNASDPMVPDPLAGVPVDDTDTDEGSGTDE